jgi:DnaJ-class molecular chaperone
MLRGEDTKAVEYEPNADKFRDVTEAYGVLSVRESRVIYDL